MGQPAPAGPGRESRPGGGPNRRPPARPHLREPSDAEVAAGRPRCSGRALAAAGPSGSFCCCAALGTADRCPGPAPSRASPGPTNGNSGERLSLTHVIWQAARGAPGAQTSPGNKAVAGASALGASGRRGEYGAGEWPGWEPARARAGGCRGASPTRTAAVLSVGTATQSPLSRRVGAWGYQLLVWLV